GFLRHEPVRAEKRRGEYRSAKIAQGGAAVIAAPFGRGPGRRTGSPHRCLQALETDYLLRLEQLERAELCRWQHAAQLDLGTHVEPAGLDGAELGDRRRQRVVGCGKLLQPL